jgi:hypothetical protein
MAIIGASNLTAAGILSQVARALINHRQALEVLNDLYAWSSGLSAADLTAAPISMSAADANALLSALADAHAEYVLHNTGQPPAAYPQAASSYMYAASQNQVIGPS